VKGNLDWRQWCKRKTLQTAKGHPLKGSYKHPEFEQFFPDLANKINIKFYEGQELEGIAAENHSNGTYTIGINTAFREKNNWASIHPTLSHEIQHVIQGLERGVRGGRKNDVGGTSPLTP
jgi:hypothetical protein